MERKITFSHTNQEDGSIVLAIHKKQVEDNVTDMSSHLIKYDNPELALEDVSKKSFWNRIFIDSTIALFIGTSVGSIIDHGQHLDFKIEAGTVVALGLSSILAMINYSRRIYILENLKKEAQNGVEEVSSQPDNVIIFPKSVAPRKLT